MFKVIAINCLAGVSHSDCDGSIGRSRDIAVVASNLPNELECERRSILDPAKSAPFRNLAAGEYVKTIYEREHS